VIGAIGSGFDRLVGVFSPAHALRRMAARDLLANARRAEKYAAAKTNRLTGSWHPVNSGVNDIIGASSSAVRGRVRQLVRDFPYFARAINSLTDYTVGEGIIYQARVQDAEGKLDRKLNQKIEDALAWWGDEADIAGKLHFYEIMRLAKRQDVESGEFLIVKTRAKDRNRYLPLALQVYEADWLASPNVRDLPSGRKEDQGIEYDGATGAVTAYHLTDPDGWGKTKRIPASFAAYRRWRLASWWPIRCASTWRRRSTPPNSPRAISPWLKHQTPWAVKSVTPSRTRRPIRSWKISRGRSSNTCAPEKRSFSPTAIGRGRTSRPSCAWSCACWR
jgi:hypothetical protein